MDSLIQLSFHVHRVLNRIGGEFDISIVQIRLFGILRDRELSMLQLAQYLDLDKSSMTGLIDRAERRGLVERISSVNDRRVIHVRVTLEGHKIIQEVSSEIERQIKIMTETLLENERSQFIAIAAKILMPDSKQ